MSSTGADAVGKVFLTEFIDDWIMMRVATKALSVHVRVSVMIAIAADATSALMLNSEANVGIFCAEDPKMHERRAAVCNLISRSMHAPTIMTLAEVMLKISQSFRSVRRQLYISLRCNNIDEDLARLRRVIGYTSGPFLQFKGASPPLAADVVTIVDCVHNGVRGQVVWEDVANLTLGNRSVTALALLQLHRTQFLHQNWACGGMALKARPIMHAVF